MLRSSNIDFGDAHYISLFHTMPIDKSVKLPGMVDTHPDEPAAPSLSSLGARVKARREELGISQVELGEMTGYSQSSIAEVERGGSKQPRRISQLAAALQTTPAWLRGDDAAASAPLRLPSGMMDKDLFRAAVREAARFLRAADLPPDILAETLIRLHDDLARQQERPPEDAGAGGDGA